MIALLALSTALAGEVTWTFDAQATGSVDGEYDGQLPPGTPLSGFMTFDEPDGASGSYADALVDAEFSVGTETWTFSTGGSVQVQNSTSDSFSTGWSFAGPALTGTGGRDLVPANITVFLADAQGGLFSSLAFPATPPDLLAIDTNQFVVRFTDTTGGGQPSATFAITAWDIVDSCPDTPKTSPGACGCDYEDVDVPGGLACVHLEATVDPGATLGDGVQIDDNAVVGSASLGALTRVGRRVQIGDNTTIGSDSLLSNSAVIGQDVIIGARATLLRSAEVQNDTTIGDDVYVGSDATVGASSVVGDDVIIGALVQLGTVDVGDGVVIARQAGIGTGTTVGSSSIIGPNVQIAEDAVFGERVRIRKDSELGDRVTLGDRTRVGRSSLLGDDSGTREDVTLRASVELGTFAHLPAGLFVPRGDTFPNDYDHDDDGDLATAMGGTDCDDFDARFTTLCTIDLTLTDDTRSWADGSYASSCDGYRNPTGVETYSGSVGSGLYNIDPDGDGTPFAAYCDMATSTGWTLAAVVAAGSGSSWTYDSPWWTVSGAAQQSDPSPSDSEGRYEVFDASPYTAIRLVDPASGREVRLDDSAASLVSRFATTPEPTLTDNGNGGHSASGRTTIPHTRYDTQAFNFLAQNNALSICSQALANDVSGWVSGDGIGLNTIGRYDASNGLFASGRARLGNWVSGSNSHIWAQTADCGFGLGVRTQRDAGPSNTGTTMGAKTLVWIQ